MVLDCYRLALSQLSDARFRRVLLTGLGLTILLLIGAIIGFFWLVQTLLPDSLDLPLIGPVSGIDTAAAIGSVFVMLVLSVFLMIPVASAFTGLFLEQIVDAVEVRHYPALPAATPVKLGDALIDAANMVALVIMANTVALIIYFLSGPLAPFVFWGVNGLLLGREYFMLTALRRLPRPAAKALRSRHFGTIWLAGGIMAAGLSLPVVNLLVPVLGVAAFTHLFHRLNAKGAV